MLARWYLLLGKFPVIFEYRPGPQHANADGMSRQCGQCQRPDCPVSAMDSPVPDAEPETEMVNQPFAASEMGESMDADLLPELSGETWVASALIEEFTAGSYVVLIAASRQDATLATVREWIHSESTPAWAECAGFFLRSCAVGAYKWAICPSTQMAGYGGVERRRWRDHNWWCPGVNDER